MKLGQFNGLGGRCGLWLTRLARVVLAVTAAMGVSCAYAQTATDGVRPLWTASRVKGSPERPAPYRMAPAYPNLKFESPVDFCRVPGTRQILVAQQNGILLSFEDRREVSTMRRVANFREMHQPFDSLYAVTLDPEFERNRFLYVCYVEPGGRTNGSFVSRFTLPVGEGAVIDAASEVVILRFLSGGHNGCSLEFGPDGHLYISTGDAAPPDPPDMFKTGQGVNDLLSCVLRVDVRGATREKPYRVPSDNPFVKMEGARPEIFAIGFRNPWRMSFGPDGALWVGDVGWELWELLHVIRKPGYNGGWSVVEGPNPAVRDDVKPGPTPVDAPLIAIPHSQAASITGGRFYRGAKLPGLKGAYLFGDWETGKVWAVQESGGKVTRYEELCDTVYRPIAFGENHSGELLMLDYGGGLYEWVEQTAVAGSEAFPRRLSETGLFRDLAARTPEVGVTRYSIRAPMWMDHAMSERWVGLPEAGKIVPGDKTTFPSNAVFAKTLYLEMEAGVAGSKRPVETQLMHFDGQNWVGYAYAWNEAGTDALLVGGEGATREIRIKDSKAPGGERLQPWRFASRADCMRCHNPWSGSVLGFGLEQLTWAGAGGTSELSRLVEAGVVARAALEKAAAVKPLANPYDANEGLEARARGWLHVNCAACHRANAGGSVATQLNYELDPVGTRALDQKPLRGGFGLPAARVIAPGEPERSALFYRICTEGSGHMPHLGAQLSDEIGVQLVAAWIGGLSSTNRAGTDAETVLARTAVREARDRIARAMKTGSLEQKVSELAPVASTASGVLALYATVPREIQAAVASAVRQPSDPLARELMQRWLPASERRKTLGAAFDPQVVLNRAGSVERGQALFESERGPNCARCHRVNGRGREYGPDLSDVGRRYGQREILEHIVSPSKLIAPGYGLRWIETRDGATYGGFVVREEGGTILLRTEDLKEVSLKRGEIVSDLASPQSAMPEGLLQSLAAEEAADLLAYLAGLRGTKP